MASQIDVYNMALARIGVYDTAVQDAGEVSKAAQVCTVFYAPMLDYVLQDFPWRFAERRVMLASLGTPPVNWSYRYAYPSDCITAKYITRSGIRSARTDQMIPFQVGNGGAVREIYCDLQDAELVYTARVTDLNQWGSIAVSALAYRLAAEIAMPMSVKPDIANSALSGYYREVSRAAAINLNEGTPDMPPISELITVRGGSANWDGTQFLARP